MTNVSDKAREAAANYWCSSDHAGKQRMLAGESDGSDLVQAFARFEAETLERAAKVAEILPGVPPPPRSGGSFAAARANQCDLVATAIRQMKGSGDE